MSSKVSFFSYFLSICLVLLLFFSRGYATDYSPSYAPDKRATVGRRWSSSPVKLNRFQKERIQAYLTDSGAYSTTTLDTLRLIALQVQFADSLMGGQEGSRRPQVRDSLFFANELQHLTDYFLGSSRNHLTITWEVASQLYTLPKAMGYYGKDGQEETRVVEMAQTAIDSADDDVDFAQFDALVIIHAGAGQETDLADDSREQIWSSFYDHDDIDRAFPDSTVFGLATDDSLGGIPFLVDNFLVFPANSSQDDVIIGSLGIWAFEMGSRIGLLPFFDSTPEGFTDSRGLGSFCLMSYGLFNANGFIPAFPCAFNRILAGWLEPVLVENDGHFNLRDINSPTGSDTACLKISITEGEYFLVVNRVHDTNFDKLFTFTDYDSNLVPDNTDSLGGAEFDFFLTDVTNPSVVEPDPNYGNKLRRFVTTGSGIYIWHVDELVIQQAVDAGFLPDDFVSRKGVDLEEADGVQDLDGVEDQSFSFGSYWDSYRSGHMDRFTPDTDPSSTANSGAGTGIVISGITEPGSYMECDVSFSRSYSEVRVRWEALLPTQPPTPVNLDGGDSTEVVVLADTGKVYVFKADGREYIDLDVDPQTVDPFLTAPGAVWTGPPAFGDLNGDAVEEIVSSSGDGRLFAWKADGTELIDGDADPLTEGVLYSGLPFAAPPILLDIDMSVDASDEIAVVEKDGDSLHVSFIDGTGNKVTPVAYPLIWPVAIQAQFASIPAFGSFGSSEGLVIAWVDTIENIYGISYTAVRQVPLTLPLQSKYTIQAGGPEWSVTLPMSAEFEIGAILISPPVVGDLDANGTDEVVVTLSDNRLLIHSIAGFDQQGRETLNVLDLRGNNPSAPAIGDVDMDGTLEIALWDDEYYYLFKHNGTLCTDWPQKRIRLEYLDLPPLSFENLGKSPLIGDINGDGTIEILFAEAQGAVRAFLSDGTQPKYFPRAAPAELSATPSLFDLDGDGELSLIIMGSNAAIEGIDAVIDTFITRDAATLSIQSLAGSQDTGDLFWSMYQGNPKRWGRTEASVSLLQAVTLAEGGSFMIYPNPVESGEVRVRIILNRRARVSVEIYNIEGERALSQEFDGNPGDIIQTPFDMAFDVNDLKSGVYFVRLHLEGASGSSVHVKPFAIKR